MIRFKIVYAQVWMYLQQKSSISISFASILNQKKISSKWKINSIVYENVLYYYYKKKQWNVCYNFFENLYSFAHFKYKGYILYSKLLLQWAVRKKNFFSSTKLKKIISRNFQESHWKKNVAITFELKRQKKIFRRKNKFWL